MSEQSEIFGAITRERQYQDRKWGTPGEHPHDVPGWLLVMRGELQEAEQAWLKGEDRDALVEILQVIAVGVACLEQHGVFSRPEVLA